MVNNIKSSFIRKRGNNYNVVVEYENDEGKIKQKTMGKYNTKKEAEKYLIEIKNEINKSRFIMPSYITLVDRCYKYIDDNKNLYSPHTIRNYNNATKLVSEFFKDTKLSDLTPYQLQSYSNFLSNKYKYNSAIRFFKFLRTVLNECYRLQEIPTKICDFVKNPVRDPKEKTNVSFYSIEEAQLLIDRLYGNKIEIPMLLMLLCGLRYSEAAGLRWKDIDFENKTLTVNQIYVYIGKDEQYFKEPKTEGSVRTITIPDMLISKLLRENKRQKILKLQGINNENDLVCINPLNKPWTETSLNRAAKKFFEDNGLRRIRLHDLRHTHSSLLLAAKVPYKAIQARLGHSSIKMTMDTYSHLMEETDKLTTELLENIMKL